MRACIITIGNEILIGRVLNTNAQYLARKLTALGIDVLRMETVKDDVDEIVRCVKMCCEEADIVITTGGLGPTYDDLTAYALSIAFRRSYRLNEEMLAELKKSLERIGVEMNDVRLKMAFGPAGAHAIPNEVGAAPGMKIVEKCLLYALPGVPSEMMDMFEKYIEPELAKMSNVRSYEVCETIEGIREADVAKVIKMFIRRGVYIKTHPGLKGKKPFVKICVLSYSESVEKAKEEAEKVLGEILERVKDNN